MLLADWVNLLEGICLREFRFAVGTKNGPRSAIWKCWVHRDEIYLSSHLFGAEAKISLHSSGVCQWSLTDNWVRSDPARRNAERHIARWQTIYPDNQNSILAFRVAIPVMELRVAPLPDGQKKAFWVDGAPPEATVEFCFFVTCMQSEPPGVTANPDLRHLASLQLNNRRWLVCFIRVISLSAVDISAARSLAIAQAGEAGVHVVPSHRIALFASPDAEHSAGVIEVSAEEIGPAGPRPNEGFRSR